MKKFLTVLLVIAVMFTFSFGTAFATLNSEQATDINNALSVKAAELQNALPGVGEAYVNSLTFDEDGYLIGCPTITIDNAYKGLVSKATIEKAVADAVYDAQQAVATKANALKVAVGGADTTVDAKVTELVSDYNTNVIIKITSNGIFGNTKLNKILPAQLKADKAAAKAELEAYATDVYSDASSGKTYKIGTTAAEKLYEGTLAADYTTQSVITMSDGSTLANGLAAGSVYPVRTFVKAMLAAQLDIVNSKAASTDPDADVAAADDKASIEAIAEAATTAKDLIKGHKRTATADYYVEAIPTISDQQNDTTLATSKAAAVKTLQAEIATKYLATAEVLKAKYDKLNQSAKPDANALNTAKERIDALQGQYDAFEEVWTANINNAISTAELETVKAGMATAINGLALTGGDNDAKYGDFNTNVESKLKIYAAVSDAVKELTEYAELIGQQKDVNGKPFYDAKALADNLAKSIETLYTNVYGASPYANVTAVETALATAKTNLADGYEEALIDEKIDLIEHVKGISNIAANKVKDLDGNYITTKWNTPKDKHTFTTNADQITKLNNYNGYGASAGNKEVFMYDKAQREALAKLVEETVAAIEAATSIEDAQKIFVEANEKYTDIDTVLDHVTNWNGKVGTAYDKNELDTEIAAYAKYLFTGKFSDTDVYPSMNENEIRGVGEAVMFEAYTVDELSAKLAEAKTAMEGLMTKEQLKAKKAEVEGVIDAIGTVTLDSKAAIIAAIDAVDDYDSLLKKDVLKNEYKLNAAKTAYEKLAAEALDKAYKALDSKAAITTADAAAIEALRAQFDAYEEFLADAGVDGSATTLSAPPTDAKVTALEGKLSKAKVAEVKAMMIKLPANPTAADRAQVEAARAAYEALTLDEKAEIIGELPWQNLIDAEEALGINNDEAAKAYVQDLSIKARSTKTAKGVKITIKADVQELLDSGYTVEYKFYRSTKSNKNFGTAKVTKTTNTYLNTSGKKGTKYYYKAKLVVKNAEGEVVATTPLTQCLYATRTF